MAGGTGPVEDGPSWGTWLERAPAPLPGVSHPDLDEKVLGFAEDPSRATMELRLPRRMVTWARRRFEQLGLAPRVTNRGRDVRVTKPSKWRADWAADARAFVLSQREKSEARMAAWSARCEECSAVLDAYGAMYHLSGMGPFCVACIEADPELDGLKWEAKADFWDHW